MERTHEEATEERSHGPQFIAKDFKEFIRISGTSELRRSTAIERQDRALAQIAEERVHSALR